MNKKTLHQFWKVIKYEYWVSMQLLHPIPIYILSKDNLLFSIPSLTNENHNTVLDSSPQRLG